MPPREVPVLIVGAGPAGLMAALLLRRLGIEAELVERRPTHQRAPAAHVVNARSFEICRAAGVDMAGLLAAAQDPADAGYVYFATRLGGEILGRHPFEQQGDDQLAVTPTPLRNISQNRFEPFLLEALGKYGAPAPRWRHQWESGEQDADGALSRIRDLETDRLEEVRSRYLLAADGAGSRIRKSLDIAVTGPDRIQSFVMIHFRAELRPYLGDPPGVLFFLFHPLNGGGAFVMHGEDEAVYMHPYDPDTESVESYDAARCEEVVRQAMEVKELPIEVSSISTWAMTAQVADRYREGRIFLVGDAAHRFPPTGGLGLNTGVQDVHNLVWKLAAVLRGEAPASLLETYEGERRPVAQSNAEQSLKNAMKLIQVAQSLGIADRSEGSQQRMEAALADPERRQRVHEAVANQAEHFDMPGLQLGFCYGEGALLRDADETPPPLQVRNFVPSGCPGSRLPHAWLRGAAPGESLLDRVPLDRFLLLAGPEGGPWIDGARKLASRELAILQLGPESLEGWEIWLRAAGIGAEGALLVRPDQHVAWRATAAPHDAPAELERVLSQVLQRTA